MIIAKVLFVLFTWMYFIFEGFTEGLGTKDNSGLETKDAQDQYHLLRLGENLGIIMAIHVLMVAAKLYSFIPVFWLSVPAGIGVYEMAFSWIKYGDPLYDKTSKWLGIPHPKGRTWIPISAASATSVALMIIL